MEIKDLFKKFAHDSISIGDSPCIRVMREHDFENCIKEKINLITKYRDEQKQQLDSDLSKLTCIQRVQVACNIEKIEGIIEGLNIAINILQ